MKFTQSNSQLDPNSSFLDIIFCLCVMLCFALAVSSFAKQEAEESKEQEVKKPEESKKSEESSEKQFDGKVQANRFSGRGGQPRLNIVLDYDKNDFGFAIKVGGLELQYKDFRKIICNIDRKESDGQPAFLFSISLSDGYKKATFNDIYYDLDEKISLADIEKAKESNSNWWIVNLYKMHHNALEKYCREFKLKNTSSVLGNWDSDSIESKKYTAYEERRRKGKPFVWFTVDNEAKRVVMGPKDDPVHLKPAEFVTFISSIEGNDGFYLEYRDPNTLKYKKDMAIPDWVLKEIIEPLGYDACVDKKGV